MNNIIYYLGVLAIIFGVIIWVSVIKFKDEDVEESTYSITLKSAIFYSLIIFIAIYTWGLICKNMFSNINKLKNYNHSIEKIVNGKEKNSF